MPELPDITAYVEALRTRVKGEPIEEVRIGSPFVLRSVEPPIETARGRRVLEVGRLGKRIVLRLETEGAAARSDAPRSDGAAASGGSGPPQEFESLYLVIHLMIAGRLHWKEPRARIPAKVGLAAIDFSKGTLTLTEAAKMKRASIRLVAGEASLDELDPGGIEPLDTDLETFAGVLTMENHTLKRALTDPTLFSGIGNAYSDEILHTARLSPILLTSRITDEEIARLYTAAVDTLTEWIERLRLESARDGFPEKVTAFRPEMAVHGRYGLPCPVCQTPVQRIVYAENETNYCPRCQTGGRILADRALSRLLKGDWPRSIDELDEARLPRRPSRPGKRQKGR